METRTVEQIQGWNSRPFSDGYAGLRELSDGEFSGAVRAAGAWLFMLNGRIIGVHEGSLDDFEGTDGTAYAAPHPSLPLLFSMQAQGGETQAKYYTNDTPLAEADQTLTDGNFTGFVELSENVLSGDYYVAYYGGRSMSVAFVGASEQVLTGDEAFERANDEVGIYEVRNVDLEVIDLPEPDVDEEPAGGVVDESSANAPSSDSTGTDLAGTDPTATDLTEPDPTTGDATSGETESVAGIESVTEAESTAETDAAVESPTGSTEGSTHEASSRKAETSGTDRRTSPTDAEQTSEPSKTADTEANAEATAGANERAPTPSETADEPAPDTEPTADVTDASAAEAESGSDDGAFADEEEWRETTVIPSLNPDRSTSRDESSGGKSGSVDASADARASASDAGSSDRSKQSRSESNPARSKGDSPRREPVAKSTTGDTGGAQSGGSTAERARSSEGTRAKQSDGEREQLRSQLQQREQQVEQLESRLSEAESERDELRRERNALRQEVERLESKLESARANANGGASGAARQLTPAQTFEATNLFVRYRSKGEATLEEAAAGDASAEDVNANLQLEHHTQFEAGDAAVDGEPFESFLTNSFEYRFASWMVEELLYEIRDTGHRGKLRDLYEAIPKIDRVDLHGSVSAGEEDDETREEAFDVIMRDRMGNPLVVADLNGSRDPTTGEMMGSLVDASTGVALANDELAGAFQVTESFFEPEALETAESATSGGILSREKRESFVKLSRKRGYHLCLVESRSGGFHLNVPEL